MPAVLGEANYEGENNQPESASTTDETLRRQVLWSLTSGAAGEFMGTHDWDFHPGWKTRLSTPAISQTGRLRDLFSGLRWWQLVPDTSDQLVTAGRGTRLVDRYRDGRARRRLRDRGADTRRPPGRRLPPHCTDDLGEHGRAPRRHLGRLGSPDVRCEDDGADVQHLHHAGHQRRRRRGLDPPGGLVTAVPPAGWWAGTSSTLLA